MDPKQTLNRAREKPFALRWPLYVAACAWLLYFGWFAVRVGTVPGIVFTGSTLLLFALPGILLGFALFGHRVLKNPESLIWGSALGLALSGFLALAIGYLFAWSIGLIVSGIAVLTLVCALVCSFYWRRPLAASRLREWDRGDYAILLAMFAAFAAFIAIPYLNVGKLTPEGHGYAWLFGFDFLLRSAIAASITHGLPPDYLHLTGNTLRIYLVSYTVPAFAYNASGYSVSMHSIVLLIQLATGLLFLSCVFAFLRRFIHSRLPLFCTAMVALLGYSYYGWYVLTKLLVRHENGVPWILGGLSASSFGNVSHLLQRLFLVEPQALAGLCVFLFVIFVLDALEYRLTSYPLALVLGLALGVEFGIEGWQGLALALWFGGVFVWRWLRAPRKFGPEYGPVALAVAVCIAVYVSYFALGVYAFSSAKAIAIRPFWWVIKLSPIYFPVEYGPMLVLGVWGLWQKYKQDPGSISVPLLILVGLTLFQIFFVTAEVLPEFGLLRGNRLLPLVLLVWTGYFFEDLFRKQFGRVARAVAVVLLVAALPTVFTDIHFTSDVKDQASTRYVRPADLAACNWIRHNLPKNVTVQSEPDYIGQNSPPPRYSAIELSLIADFAERPMAVGEYWIAGTVIPGTQQIAKKRYRDVHEMFRAKNLPEVTQVVQKYNLQYLYVGPYEQKLYPNFLGLLKSAPQLFTEVYAADGVYIFKWNGRGAASVSAENQQASKEH